MPQAYRRQIHVLGDSISLHYGQYLKPWLADHLDYRVKQDAGDAFANLDIPQGSSSGDSRMTLAYLRKARQEGLYQPDLALVNCGLHDIKVAQPGSDIQVPLEEYRQNLASIIDLHQQAGVPMVWVAMTHSVDAIHNNASPSFHRYARDNDAYARAADQIMRGRDIPVIDLRGFTQKLGGDEVFCDHVHFIDAVRRQQAAYLAGWVSRWFGL